MSGLNTLQNRLKSIVSLKEDLLILEEHIRYIKRYVTLLQILTCFGKDKIVAVGRICCDASEGKLNAQSIVLETSRDLGMGKRVQLDVSRVEQYSLFPGQVQVMKLPMSCKAITYLSGM